MTKYYSLSEPVLIGGMDPCYRTLFFKEREVEIRKREQGQSLDSHGILIKHGSAFIRPNKDNTVAYRNGISTLCIDESLYFPEHLAVALALADVTDVTIVVKGLEAEKVGFPYMRVSGLTQLVEELRAARSDEVENGSGWSVVQKGTYEKDGARITATPYDGLRIVYTARVPGNGVVTSEWDAGDENATERVAAARALINKEVVDPSLAPYHGFGVKGDVKNSPLLFFDETTLLNPSRYGKIEFVDHKIQDFLGTFWLLLPGIEGEFTVEHSGHAPDLAALTTFLFNRTIQRV